MAYICQDKTKSEIKWSIAVSSQIRGKGTHLLLSSFQQDATLERRENILEWKVRAVAVFHGQVFHRCGISKSWCVCVIVLGRLQEDRQATWDFFKDGLGQGFSTSIHFQELVASTSCNLYSQSLMMVLSEKLMGSYWCLHTGAFSLSCLVNLWKNPLRKCKIKPGGSGTRL